MRRSVTKNVDRLTLHVEGIVFDNFGYIDQLLDKRNKELVQFVVLASLICEPRCLLPPKIRCPRSLFLNAKLPGMKAALYRNNIPRHGSLALVAVTSFGRH